MKINIGDIEWRYWAFGGDFLEQISGEILKINIMDNGDIGLAGRRLLQFLLHKQHSCSRLQLDPLSSSPSSSPSLLTSSTRWQGGKNTLYGIDITEVSECKLIYQKY